MDVRPVIVLVRHKDGWSPEAQAAGVLLVRLPGDVYDMEVARIAANTAAGLVFDPAGAPVDWWTAPGRILAAEPCDAVPYATAPAPGSLRIVQGTGYDPGSAAYRFHTAVNETTQHASAFVRYGDSNPYCSLRQYDGAEDKTLVRRLIWDADVLHCHINYMLWANVDMPPRGLVIRHYHGSRRDGSSWIEQPVDDALRAVQVGARLSHLQESPRMQWLPIAVPVARYAALRVAHWHPGPTFRVAHSPTKRAIKGTDEFLAACDALRRRGVPIEPVLIEGRSHTAALEVKATCDACFDSFWLGIQGSGLEAAAMGQPVIAGDPAVAELYLEHAGAVPYTYADDGPALEAALERLAMDPRWREQEAGRVERYVWAYHDYAAVAARYERILAVALERDDIITPAAEPTVAPVGEPVTAPTPKPKRTPKRAPLTTR